MLAIQKVSVAVPSHIAASLQALDLNTATEVLVSAMFKNPVDKLVQDPATFEIALYSLAHQWGMTQIALDYVDRCDNLLDQRYNELKKKKRRLTWSNFFLGLSSMGYAMSNANATPAQRISNEFGITRNQQATQLNYIMSEYYQNRTDNIEELRLQVSNIKQQLRSYSNLLEIYRGWLFGAVDGTRIEKVAPDAAKVLLTGSTVMIPGTTKQDEPQTNKAVSPRWIGAAPPGSKNVEQTTQQTALSDALIKATMGGQVAAVRTFLTSSVDVNTKDRDGSTALIIAASLGHDAIVQILLTNRADVNAKDNEGKTALMWAASKGHTAIVQMLLVAGVDVNLKDKYEKTALMKAESWGNKDIVQLLRQAGARE